MQRFSILYTMIASDNPVSIFYDPTVRVADIEVWLNVSYGTAKRRLQEMRRALGLGSRERVTKEQAKNFFRV